ncbi:34768_t:CDS:2, partial [Racocetra persica]
CLEKCLETETHWNRFNQYKSSTKFATMPTAGHDLFLAVVEVIDRFLTKSINNIINNSIQVKSTTKRPLQSKEININTVNTSQTISKKPDDSYSDKENNAQLPENVQNPTRVIGKRRPTKRHYKSSIEKQQNRQRTLKGIYRCRQCGKVGHNTAYHKQKGRSDN